MRETKCTFCETVIEEGDRCLPCVDRRALDTIANALDQSEWDADTFGIVVDAVRLTGRVVRDYQTIVDGDGDVPHEAPETVSTVVHGCPWCQEGIVSVSDAGPQCSVCGALDKPVTPEHLKAWLRERIARHKEDVQMPPAFKGGQGHTAEEIKENGDLWLGVFVVVISIAAGIGVGWLAFHVR